MALAGEIVVVDDDPQILELQQEALNSSGLQARTFTDPVAAWEFIRRGGVRLVVSDWEMGPMSGLELLFKTRGLPTPPHVIMLTGYGSVDRAVQAMTQGAMSFIEKPFDPEKYIDLIRSALYEPQTQEEGEAKPRERRATQGIQTPIYRSHAMGEALEMARAAAVTDSTVLLLGESGTGKEVLANYIHTMSPRGKGPLVSVNCGALPEHLMESELFGHEKGAFTGADRRRIGRFEQADKGTLFLDEIGDLLPSLQVKLLRALQLRVIERVGSNLPVPVDFRLICATHRNLGEAVKTGTFREDLFYRINVIPIPLPALRERREDVEPLTEHFFQAMRERIPKGPERISKEALACLGAYAWPGNVRQLRNAIEFALVMCRDAEIKPKHLPPELSGLHAPATTPAETAAPGTPLPATAPGPLSDKVQELEAAAIRAALDRHDWNIASVTDELKISRSVLYDRMKAYGIKRN